jgi:hypothetical protein
MTDRPRKPNDPHDKFIKQFVPVVLKNFFESQTSVSLQLPEELAICTAIRRDGEFTVDPSLGLLGRLVAIHPTIVIEHYSNIFRLRRHRFMYFEEFYLLGVA